MDDHIRYNVQNRISCVQNLANALSEDLTELVDLSQNTDNLYYKKQLPKKTGGWRTVYVPDRNLKRVQRKINSRIFSEVKFPPYLQGSISDSEIQRDHIQCATLHCGAVAVSHIDIKDFFENIDYDHVVEIFDKLFQFPDDVSQLLSNLVTLNSHIPQGAPTSSYIANMVFFREEPNLAKNARRIGATYTRLVDDITISTTTPNRSLDRLTRKTKQAIESKGMEINENKSKTQTRGHYPLKVHGIKVVEKKPKIDKKEYQEIRRDVHLLAKQAETANYRKKFSYYKAYHKTSGKLSKLKRVNHPAYNRLRQRLRNILPLPSKHFKEQTASKVARLENLHNSFANSEWFKKEWNVTNYRLGIVGRIYRAEARQLRSRLYHILPN